MNITLYIVGWILFVAGQAQNSVRSKTNGLPEGIQGFKMWLAFHAVNLSQRAFFSGLFYGFIVHATAAKLEAAGFVVTSYTIAGCGGFLANVMLYQIFGLLGMGKETADLAPPPNAQIIPVSPSQGDTKL